MIENRIGNLLEQPDLNCIGHCCNCFHTFGSGIAKTIREKFPEAYEADCRTIKGDKTKLGTFSFAELSNGKGCFNIYGQYMYGRDKQYLNYDALKHGLFLIKNEVKYRYGNNVKLGLPYKIGCCNAGGDWNIVLNIIKEEFENNPITVVICQFKEYSKKDDENLNKLRKAYKKFELMGDVDYD